MYGGVIICFIYGLTIYTVFTDPETNVVVVSADMYFEGRRR